MIARRNEAGHDAALTIKRLCRQAGKRYLPLRSASVASFAVALRDCAALSVARNEALR